MEWLYRRKFVISWFVNSRLSNLGSLRKFEFRTLVEIELWRMCGEGLGGSSLMVLFCF
jgi:hypothetical protein